MKLAVDSGQYAVEKSEVETLIYSNATVYSCKATSFAGLML